MNRNILFIVCSVLLFIAGGCTLQPITDDGSKGGLLFDFDLSYPKSLGYDINQVQVTLTHQTSLKEVKTNLTVDSVNNRASALVRNLRPGIWNVFVELFEAGTRMGQGSTTVEIKAGITSQVTVHVTLSTGNVEVIVDWGDTIGPNISLSDFNNDFGEIEVGSTSTPREVTIYNTGTENLLISNIILPDTANFSIDLNGGSKPIGNASAVIPPGGKATLTITFTPKTAGAHTVDLQIASNIISKPVFHLPWIAIGRPQFVALPNLAPVNFISPSIAHAGEAIGESVTLGVTNSLGEAKAADGFITVAFYLSSDWLWSTSDVLLDNGKANVATPIAFNETKTVPVPPTLRIPAGTPVGTYYLLAVVDDDKEVFENNETNNVSANTLAIASGIQVSGTLKVGMVGELGNYFDVSFISVQNVTLVDVSWDWTGHNVWVDPNGANLAQPINQGVSSYHFHWGDPPTSTQPTSSYQVFGYSALGFDTEDYLRITTDLDRNASGGSPLYEDYYGGNAKLRFSDGTTIVVVYNTPVTNDAYAAKAEFSYTP
jgi:hypothetical protein